MPLQVRLVRNQSVLSEESLSLDEETPVRYQGRPGTSYRRNGVRIRRFSKPRIDRLNRYPKCVIAPALTWFPSTYANFVIGEEIRPERVRKLVPNFFNPSVWISAYHNDCFVLRVPKDRKQETRDRLYASDWWYHGGKCEWFRRKRDR